ncbi:50S ribosomal protein L1 [Candidatus Phytoplasma mali]|uniref:Large ribosomal subunit protein uL1 n=1 Tax=Phytoplasma mali (strain AT) TaxID=482235 RepID=B3QZG7_PHYMT|nr:50S ribosomal protein L1 [Candidatus Phytoplasma mali]CAP18574.1 50S ribosomal protein L1 [Candidatus Phytoplasma mali]
MKKRGKKYLSVKTMVDKNKLYSLQEAIELIKQISTVKFDASVDCSFRFNINPNKADQNIRGVIVLPHGIGKVLKVAVIAKSNEAQEAAKKAGADYIGEQELINKISKNWFDFDVLVSTPEMMPQLSKLGRVLGPKGLMPNPKTETVTNDVFKAVQDIKNGKVEYRTDKTGNINLMIGKISFSAQQILENFKTLYENLMLAKQNIKNLHIKNISISSTMSPGVKINPIFANK